MSLPSFLCAQANFLLAGIRVVWVDYVAIRTETYHLRRFLEEQTDDRNCDDDDHQAKHEGRWWPALRDNQHLGEGWHDKGPETKPDHCDTEGQAAAFVEP